MHQHFVIKFKLVESQGLFVFQLSITVVMLLISSHLTACSFVLILGISKNSVKDISARCHVVWSDYKAESNKVLFFYANVHYGVYKSVKKTRD